MIVSCDESNAGAVYVPAVVDICATAEKQVLNGLEVLGSLVSRLEDNKFRGTIVEGFLSLRLGGREDNDVSTLGSS